MTDEEEKLRKAIMRWFKRNAPHLEVDDDYWHIGIHVNDNGRTYFDFGLSFIYDSRDGFELNCIVGDSK